MEETMERIVVVSGTTVGWVLGRSTTHKTVVSQVLVQSDMAYIMPSHFHELTWPKGCQSLCIVLILPKSGTGPPRGK